jgi:hypothetical protein
MPGTGNMKERDFVALVKFWTSPKPYCVALLEDRAQT